MESNNTTCSNFDVNEFVDNLITKGPEVPCDNTNDKYNVYELPQDFDEAKFRKGQAFFNDNIFSLFFGKLYGLVTILAIPSILKILIFTNMSSTNFTAYKRYMSTIFHMLVWYKNDFYPGSATWVSMEDVRRRHNIASKRSICIGASRITQFDMALTQFGFMGYALTNPKGIGLYTNDEEGLRSWIYLWRTVGDLMGIEERFNICRDSVEETRAICEALVEKQFMPNVKRWDSDFMQMASAMLDGMWVMQPFLDSKMLKVAILRLLAYKSDMYNEEFEKLSDWHKFLIRFQAMALNSYRNWFWKWYHNMNMYLSLWLMHYFPFLAIYKYGWEDGYVRILEQSTVREVYQSG